MLDELKNIGFPDLVDLLSKYTAIYTKLLATGDRSSEFITAKEMIKLIQGEIQMRKSRTDSNYHLDPGKSEESNNQANA